MTWWSYVVETSGTDSPKAMQASTGIDGPNFSRWKAGHVPKVDLVAKFARSYRKPVLEAFVAAGFLTAEEAKARPAAAPDYSKLSNEQLLELLRGRLVEPAAVTGRVTEGAGEGERASERTGGNVHDLRKASRVDVVFADPSVLVNEFLNRAGGDVGEAIRQFADDHEIRQKLDDDTWLQTMSELNRQLALNDTGGTVSDSTSKAARRNPKRPPKGPDEQRGD